MAHYDAPNYIVSNAVISMNYIITRIHNSSGCRNFDIGSELQQSIHCFANYSYVAFDSTTQTHICQIYVVPSGASLEE